jgi:ATP synthase protein I
MTEPASWYRSRQRSTPASSLSQRAPQPSPAMDNAAWTISSRMIAGIVLYAGLGWLISLWWGNRSALIAIGAFVGLGLSYYLIFTGLAREDRMKQRAQHAVREGKEDRG